MAKKSLPYDETVMKHLLAVARDCLNFMEPAVRQLEYEKRIISAAVLEQRLDIRFFEKVHEALTDRLAQGGPSYSAILPYLELSQIKKPQKSVELANLEQRLRAKGGTEQERVLYLSLTIWGFFEKVNTARAAVQAVQVLQAEILDKLSEPVLAPPAPLPVVVSQAVHAPQEEITDKSSDVVFQPVPETQSASPAEEPIESNKWYHDQAEDPPEVFVANGPIAGQKKQLCRWVGPINDRTFTNKCRRGTYWVRKVKETQYELWFNNAGEYRRADNRRLAKPQPGW